jgi:MFS family permease
VFKIADDIGRKNELVIGSVLYTIGAIVETLSARPNWSAQTGISVLILGRVIYGCGIGFSMHGSSRLVLKDNRLVLYLPPPLLLLQELPHTSEK